MKVTTLFGHSSSAGGGRILSEPGGGKLDAVVMKGGNKNNNVENISHNDFIPIESSITPTSGNVGNNSLMPGAPPAVERASSEVLYSSITTR